MSILKEYRCSNCNKLFFKGRMSEGKIQVKCKGCKSFNEIKAENCLFLSKIILDVLDKKEITLQDFKKIVGECQVCERCITCPYCNKIKELAENHSLCLISVDKAL